MSLSGEVDSLSTTVVSIRRSRSTVDTLSTTVVSLSGEVDTLSTNVTDISGDLDNLTTTVTDLSGVVADLSENVDNLSSDVTGNSISIENLTGIVNDLSVNLLDFTQQVAFFLNLDLSTSILDNSININELTLQVAANTSGISQLEAKVEDISNVVDDLIDDVYTNSNNISELSNEVSSISNELVETNEAVGILGGLVIGLNYVSNINVDVNIDATTVTGDIGEISFNQLNNTVEFYGISKEIIINETLSGIVVVNNSGGNDLLGDLSYNNAGTITFTRPTVDNIFDLIKDNILELINDNGGREEINNAGQTYYEARCQQPPKFTLNPLIVATDTFIEFKWDYSNIVPFFNDNILAMNSHVDNISNRVFPHIIVITLQIRPMEIPQVSNWVTFTNIPVSPDDNYFVLYEYTNFTIYRNNANFSDIFLSGQTFEVRIFGSNNSNNFPTVEDRSLLFQNLSFPSQISSNPGQPEYSSSQMFYNNFNLSYTALNNLDDPDDMVLFDNWDLSYSIDVSTCLASTTVDYDYSMRELSSNIIYSQSPGNFTISLDNEYFRYGSNLNNSIRVSNSYNDEYSAYSDFALSTKTDIPQSLSTHSKNNINVNFNNSLTYVTSKFEENVQRLYLNYALPSTSFNFQNTTWQNFEISKEYFIGQVGTNVGFGKYLDTSDSLFNVEFIIDGVTNLKLEFPGFTNLEVQETLVGDFTDYIINVDIYDLYRTVINKEGFRIGGNFRLYNYSVFQLQQFLPLSQSPHTFELKTYGLSELGFTDKNDSETLYSDLLQSTPPQISSEDLTFTINTFKYCFGYPSVQNFNMNFTRENINILILNIVLLEAI